jgi:hypothetical protein
MHGVNWILTVCDLSGNELQGFVEKYHWNGELHNGNPFFTRQRGHLEYGLKQTNLRCLLSLLNIWIVVICIIVSEMKTFKNNFADVNDDFLPKEHRRTG